MSETLLPPEESPLAGQPLAARMRPASLDEIVGQQHLLGPGKVLRRLISSDVISSMIFWGPPGVGKTTLARVIALQTQATFIDFSAVTSGIKEIRQVMLKAEENRTYGVRTIVFVDEIHRFNKAQQDAFLPFVEKGSIVLIGATTENPSFEVNSALLSRCKVFVLQALTRDDILTLLRRALADERGAHEAEQRAREGDEQHLHPVDVLAEAEHPDAWDGEGQASRHHRAGAHDDLCDIRLVETAVTEGAQKYERADGRKDGRPG